MNRLSSLSVWASFSVFLFADGWAVTAPAAAVLPTPLASAASAGSSQGVMPPAPKPSYSSYTYYGEKYRDPFIPLLGDSRPDTSNDRPPAIASLTLKGIVQDANGRMALLSSGVASYILRGGRMYDGRNRMVKKISGVIKADSVVIIGSDRTIREIRTKASL